MKAVLNRQNSASIRYPSEPVRRIGHAAQRFLIYFMVAAGAVVLCIPFWWMVTTSIKPLVDVFIFPPEIIPSRIRWSNYSEVFQILDFALYFRNSAVITALTVLGQTASSAIVGYGFAKLRFPGRNALFVLMLSTLMIPYHTTLIPQFILFRTLGWINTYNPLVVPAFFGTPFFIFLYRQFFLQIPKEYNDAAVIDGCGYWGTFVRIILPMSLPAVGTVAIFSFNHTWNDFLGPLIYINSADKRTVQLGINAMRGLYQVEWHLLMAASIVALIPTVLVFFLLQRRMIQGIVVTGIKG